MSDANPKPNAKEQANIDLVLGLVNAWGSDSFDIEKTVRTYFDDGSVVRFLDTMPALSDLNSIIATWKTFRANGETMKTKVVATSAKGPVVFVNRIDTQSVPDKGSQSFEMAGVFAVKDGKIKEWTDYIGA